MSANFQSLTKRFSQSPPRINNSIIDFTPYIGEKTANFVGREWVFQEIDEFINIQDCGYFVLACEPGMGKSSIAAQLVLQRGYVHHFNSIVAGITSAVEFRRNVCSQLIALYNLEIAVFPDNAFEDATFFADVLGRVSKVAQDHSVNCVIVVDALDEVTADELIHEANPLTLPVELPHRVFFMVTTRHPVNLSSTSPVAIRTIRSDDPNHIADLEIMVAGVARLSPSQEAIGKYDSNKNVAEMLLERSGGNLLFLKYLLNEISSGSFSIDSLDELPIGLKAYYRKIWDRFQSQGSQRWNDQILPILTTLTVIGSPISAKLLAGFSGVDEAHVVEQVLGELRPLIHVNSMQEGGRGIEASYQLYHRSFKDFVVEQDGELFDLQDTQARITKVLLEGFPIL